MGAFNSSEEDESSVEDICSKRPCTRNKVPIKFDNLCDVVNAVTSGKFNLDINNTSYEEFIQKEELVDPLKPLKDVATDFVVEHFFSSEESLFQFMQIVYNTFDDLLSIYQKRIGLKDDQLFFVYKGGNVMRIVASEFLLELPSSATKKISDFYAPYFKRSDADFSIYLDPTINNYDKIYHEIGLMSYLLQYSIRQKFLAEPDKFFDYPKYNKNYKQKILSTYLNKFNDLEGFPQFTNLVLEDVKVHADRSQYRYPQDIAIQPIRKNVDGTVRTARSTISRSGSYMLISYNSSLDFYSDVDKTFHTKFLLTRTKVSMTLYRKHKSYLVNGELIDVSMDHKDNDALKSFWPKRNESVVSYDLKYKNCKLNFKSYSISYLIKDLEKILFLQFNLPWDNSKYVKRLNRLFYFYFVDLFIQAPSGDDRMNVLEDLLDMVIVPLIEYSEKIEQSLSTFLNRYDQSNYQFVNLVVYLTELLPKIQTSNDIEQLKEMATKLEQNGLFLLDTLSLISSFCSVDGKIIERSVYDTDVSELV